MALLWVDGFEKYGTVNSTTSPADVLEWKYHTNGISGLTIAPGATVGNCIKATNAAFWLETPELNVPEDEALICGFAVKFSGITNEAWVCDFRQANNYGHVVDYSMLNLRLSTANTNNEIDLFRGSLQLDSSNGSGLDIQPDTWYYIEFKATCANVGGRAEVWVDENKVIDFTGDTRYVSLGYPMFNRVAWRSNSSDDVYIDDLYICDSTGNTNNDTLGTCNVYSLAPDSDVSGNWTPSTGNDFYSVLNEDAQNANYISDDTTDNQVIMALENLPTGGTVHGVAITVDSEYSGNLNKYTKLLTQNDTGNVVLTGNCVSGGASTPVGHLHAMDYDPDGNSWDPSTVNSLRVGVRVS